MMNVNILVKNSTVFSLIEGLAGLSQPAWLYSAVLTEFIGILADFWKYANATGITETSAK